MRVLLLVLMLFFIVPVYADGYLVSISSSEPASLTVCGQPQTFTVDIDNPSPFSLTNVSLTITMPSGINYQAGTVTGGTEQNITNLSAPVFSISNMATLSHLTITFQAVADCDVIGFISGGNMIENHIVVNYTGNGSNNFDQLTTSTYVIKQPNLSITNVTNQSYTGNIGDSYTRCITIQNSGLGELSQFSFTDTHGTGILVTAVDKGSWPNTGSPETITLSGADFTSIGDGDNLFETNESITICENITIQNCVNASSDFKAYWGCNGKECQSSTSSANVVFPNLLPNVVVVANNGNISSPTKSCLGPGVPTQQKLMVTNNGQGVAINVQLDIFQGYSNVYLNFIASTIDINSFMIQNGSEAPVAAAVDSSWKGSAYACLPANPRDRAWITLPVLNPGDTVYITWNTYSCCSDFCVGPGYNLINSWQVKGRYDNICQTQYLINPIVGHEVNGIGGQLQDDNSTTNLGNGQTGTFGFEMVGFSNNYATGPGAHWTVEYTLPPCLTYSGGFKIDNASGTSSWSPSSITVSGSTITATFDSLAPFSLEHAHFSINAGMDCNSCGGGTGTVSIKITFTPDTTCGCSIALACKSVSVDMNCPSACSEGMIFSLFDMKRTSYGLPDNDNDGLPDGSGVLNPSKIRTNRAMFGDTITCKFTGTIKTSGTHPTWNYCYAKQSFSHGSLLTFVDATLRIYQASSGNSYTCNSFIPVVTTSSPGSDFEFDLSAAVLIANGCVPAGFVFSNSDSVVFTPRYKVTTNGSGQIICKSVNSFYVSDIASPTNGSDKYQCGIYDGVINIITYYYTLSGADAVSSKGCNTVQISETYYLSVGPCCGNYAGGNIFPFEYRNWSHVQTMSAVVPSGYQFVSAYFIEYRTAGSNITAPSPTININPINAGSDTLIFNLEQYSELLGGNIPLSDDGYHGYIVITLLPTCEVTPFIASPVTWAVNFAETNWLLGSATLPFVTLTDDNITYDATDIFLQSLLPSVLAPDKTASWDITLSNTTLIDAMNVWIAAPQISGVTVIKVEDVDSNKIVPNSGEVYMTGTLPGQKTRKFRVTASFSSCQQDSIVLYTGWNCGGYPADVASYPCTPDSIVLKLTPQVATVLPTITGPAGTIALCDTSYYTVNGLNIQLGTAYDLQLQITLPAGVTIVPGTSQMSYPDANPFISISDPVHSGGTMWQWNISAIDSLIDTNGLKGVLQSLLNSITITFGVVTDCNYTSGSMIGFNFLGHSACGLPISKEVSLSTQLGITGVVQPYTTEVELKTTYLSPCANGSTMNVSVFNKGPQTTGGTDSVTVVLPTGVLYVNNSFVGIHNSPVAITPYLYGLNNVQYLIWKIPPGVAVGDSIQFSFKYYGVDSMLECNINKFFANTTSTGSVNCIKTGSGCNIDVITGDTVIPVFTYKAYLALANGNSTSIPNPPSDETVTLNMDIVNTGEAILPGHKSAIHFYYDSNNNGVYNNSDVFIESDSLVIGNNTTLPYSNTINIPAGKACAILAVIDTGYNSCICNPAQMLFKVQLLAAGNDKNICSNDTASIGYDPINTYTYSWTQLSGAASLSSTTISNPVVTGVNAGSVNDTLKYVVSVQRGSCNSKDTVNVIVYPEPIANAGIDTAVCIGGTVTLNASGGTVYAWSPATGLSDDSIFNPVATLNGLQQYIVTVANAAGCKDMDTLLVNVNPLPIAAAGNDTTICFGGTAAINGSASSGTPAYTYSWSASGTAATASSFTLNPVNDTLFTLVVTDSKGCVSSSKQINVTVLNPLTVDLTGPTGPVCATDSATLHAVGTGGTGTYTFTWMPGNLQGDSITVPPGTLTTFTVTVSDGCTIPMDKDSITVTIIPLPVVAVSPDTAVCSGLSVDLIATGGATYTWMPATTLNTNTNDSAVATPVIPTMYTVTVADVIGCKSIDSVYVQVHPNPVINAGNDTLICAGKSVTLTAAGSGGQQPYTYSWNNSSNGNTLTFTPTADTICYAGLTDLYGCRSVNDSIEVTITKPLLVDAAPYISVCKGDSVKLTASASGGNGPYMYQWMPGNYSGQTITVGPMVTTYYTLTVTDGCALVPVKDTIPVMINPLPVPQFSVNDTDGCVPLFVIFTNSSTGNMMSWSWSFGNGNISAAKDTSMCYVDPGVYTVALTAVTDSGCKATLSHKDMITVYGVPNADFSYSPKTATVGNASIDFTDSSAYAAFWNWDFGDETNTSSSFVQSPTHNYHDTGTYCITLIATSIHNCVDTAKHCLDITPETSVYIPNAFSPNGDGLNEEFFVSGAFIQNVEMLIYDRWGNLIFEGQGNVPKWNGKVDGGIEIVQQDVFVYYILLTDYFGKQKEYMGHVTVAK